MYSTLQLPSLLSLQDIFASEAPSIVRPRPPVPAPLREEPTLLIYCTCLKSPHISTLNVAQQYLVSTVKQLGLLVIPPSRPGP